jgi:hypothetical protein
MPDATITSTASTFGTISGVFSADQSTISGTISGIVPGTLTGSVGVPGPAGPGVPAGGTSGQFLQKTSGVDYATDWVTVNLTGLATESWVTAGFYPLSGNPSGFLTASSLTPYLTKADNLASVASPSSARTNLGLGTLDTPTFAGVTVQGSGANVANLTPTSLSLTHVSSGSFTIQPSVGITFPDASVQTTAFTGIPSAYISSVSSPLSVTSGNLSVDLSAYLTSATAASTYQTLSGMSSYLTTSAASTTYQTLAAMSDYLAKAGNLAGLANTSTARTNLGLGSLAVVNDAPSDGSQYARKNGAWDVVSVPASYITSVSSPLSVTTGNLSVDLSAYLTSATAATTYAPIAAGLPDNGVEGQILVKQSATAYDADWQDNFATELRMPARNETGATLTKGTVVYISGGAGNKPLLAKALATGDSTSAQTIGLVTADIPHNSNGDVTIRGQLKDLDTSAFSVGAQLYLSGTTAGTYTATKTLAPTHLVYVGIVVRSNATEGAIEVAVQNGYELGEIHDVSIGTLANNDLLAYESSTDLWKNKTYSALGLLTSATAASTYYLQTNPAGYQTAAQVTTALSPYLTSATAASTYATILEPSVDGILTVEPSGSNSATVNVNQDANNYIHLRAGAGQIAMVYGGATKWFFNDTYLQFPGGTQQTVAYPGPTGFLLKADNLSGLANTGTARTNLGLGTMATATAADYSTTTAANGLYYPLSSNPAGYLTTAPVTSVAGRTGAVTLAVADVSGAAPLASPTFTATPAAPTATAGTSTTQIATTAFVQQEVPAASTTAAGKVELATTDEALRPSSSTLGMTPDTTREMLMYPGYIQMFGAGNYATSGAGATNFVNGSSRWTAQRSPNATIAGYAMYIFDYSFTGIGMAAMTRGVSSIGRKWNNKIWASGRTVLGQWAETTSGLNGDANCTARVMVGGRSSAGTGGMQAADPGIGWRVAGGGSVALVMTVSNGSSVTETTSSFTPVLGQVFDWKMYSDGTGNVTLWVNDSQVATSTGGPTTSTTENLNFYCQVVEQTASATVPFAMGNFGTKVFWSPA